MVDYNTQTIKTATTTLLLLLLASSAYAQTTQLEQIKSFTPEKAWIGIGELNRAEYVFFTGLTMVIIGLIAWNSHKTLSALLLTFGATTLIIFAVIYFGGLTNA